MKVSAIIVTYNRVLGLKHILKCLFNQTYKLNRIIIVNNNSHDGTEKYLEKFKLNPKIIVKNMKTNVGGSGGFSEGIKIAFEKTESRLFWLMDDDALPTNKALEKLIIAAKFIHYNFGFLCSNVRWSKNNMPVTPTADSDWSKLLPSNLIKVTRAIFVSFMVSRKVVAKVGLPIRQMFIWGDDVEYSLRLHNHWPCYFVSNSIVMHNTSAANNSLFNMSPSRDKYLGYSFRNELYAYRKNSGIKGLIKKILKDIYFIIRIPFLSKHRKLRKLYYTIFGFIEGFFFNPKIEYPNNNKRNKY